MALRQSNRGSGNRKSSYGKEKDTPGTRDMAQHLMEENEEFRKRVEVKTEEAWEAATSFLLGVVKGEDEEIGADTRIRAAKVLKEYTLDKTLADKKDKEARGIGGSATELVKALQDIELKRKAEAERIAMEAGKLAKIGDKKAGG